MEIRLVVNGNLVHTAVVPQLQLVASRVSGMQYGLSILSDLLITPGQLFCVWMPKGRWNCCVDWSAGLPCVCVLGIEFGSSERAASTPEASFQALLSFLSSCFQFGMVALAFNFSTLLWGGKQPCRPEGAQLLS